MKAGKETRLKLIRPQNESARGMGAVLADVYKALKSVSFYPAGHPLRNEIIQEAHKSLQFMLAEKELVLIVARSGFSTSDGAVPVEANQMTQALAAELFKRRIQRLTLFSDLTLEDFREFLQLLSLDLHKLASAGGMASEMVVHGIRTIWANEIDLSVIWEKRQAMDTIDLVSAGAVEETGLIQADEDAADATLGTNPPDFQLPEEPEKVLEELIAGLKNETDDNRYQQLARMLADKAEKLKENGIFMPLLPAIELLMQHGADGTRGSIKKEYALFILQQIAGGAMTDFLLQQLEGRGPLEKERIYPVLKQLGVKVAYEIIQRLCLADGLLARKSLAAALLQIGPAAVPPLLTMLKDERWYVVRNMVAILGQIGCKDCASSLRPAIYHPDPRVRKEAVRSLLKIGGKDVETIIIGLLDDKDEAIARQAILSLGLMKSAAAVQPLVLIMEKRDFFMRQLAIKKDAMQALGRIGDRRATPYLLKVLEARVWLFWGKWGELKVAAAAALGYIGDETSLQVLKANTSRGGRLGSACSEALDNIERIAEGEL